MRWEPFSTSATPPSKRYAATAVAIDQRVLLYGGTQGGTVVGELWVLEVMPGSLKGAWVSPMVEGDAPPGRSGHSACLVLAGRKRNSLCIFFAGDGLDGPLADVAVLRLHARPEVVDGEEAIFRATTKAEVKEGTEQVTLTKLTLTDPLGPPLSLRWLLHATPSTELAAEASAEPVAAAGKLWPAARQGHAAATIFDDSILIFGGSVRGFELLDDLWCLHVHDGGSSIDWEQPVVSGDVPPESAGHTLSAIGVRALLLGGSLLDCAYVLDATSWVWARLEAGEGSLSRSLHAAVPLGKRVLLLGGVDANTDEELDTAVSVRLESAQEGGGGRPNGAAGTAGDAGARPQVIAMVCAIERRGSVKPPPARSHVCGVRVGSTLLFLGGRGGGGAGNPGGENACCIESEDEARQREQVRARQAQLGPSCLSQHGFAAGCSPLLATHTHAHLCIAALARMQDEEDLAEEVASALKASKADAKAEEKRKQKALAAQAAAAESEAAAMRAEAERRAREAADKALRERGEAAAAALREEHRRKEKEEREAKEALKASRTGGGFKLEPKTAKAALKQPSFK